MTKTRRNLAFEGELQFSFLADRMAKNKQSRRGISDSTNHANTTDRTRMISLSKYLLYISIITCIASERAGEYLDDSPHAGGR